MRVEQDQVTPKLPIERMSSDTSSPALSSTVWPSQRTTETCWNSFQGRSNGQIVTELHLLVKAVQNYVSAARRSGCATAAAMVSWARVGAIVQEECEGRCEATVRVGVSDGT